MQAPPNVHICSHPPLSGGPLFAILPRRRLLVLLRRRAAPRRAPAAPPSRQHHARGVSHAVEGHPRAVEDVRLVLAEAARGENLVQSCQGELPARHPQRCLLSAPRGSPRAAHARHPPPPRAPHSLSMTSSTCHKGTGWPPGARPARQQPLGAEKGKPFSGSKKGPVCRRAGRPPRAHLWRTFCASSARVTLHTPCAVVDASEAHFGAREAAHERGAGACEATNFQQGALTAQ